MCQVLLRPTRSYIINPEKDAWGLPFPSLVSLEDPCVSCLFGWCVLNYGEHRDCASVAEEYLAVTIVVLRESSRFVSYTNYVPCCSYAVRVVSLGWLWVVR